MEPSGSPDKPNNYGFRSPDIESGTFFGSDSGNRKDSNDSRGSSSSMKGIADGDELDDTLPKYFTVRYLGKRDAAGLWGIRYTRKPVDAMVADAKKLENGERLPNLHLKVFDKGVRVCPASKNEGPKAIEGLFQIKTISYGVQDIVYTRVFAIIVVRETTNVIKEHPFSCHAFVCDSRETARRLTFALAAAFKIFSNTMEAKALQRDRMNFAIDLRPVDRLQAELEESEDSEV